MLVYNRITQAKPFQIKNLMKSLPQSFRLGSVFSLPGDRFLFVERSFGARGGEAIRLAFQENAFKTSLLNKQHICVIPKDHPEHLSRSLEKKFSVISIDHRISPEQVRAEIYKAFLTLGEERDAPGSLLLRVISDDPEWMQSNRSRILARVHKALNLTEFIVERARSSFKDGFSDEEIREAVASIPEDMLRSSTPQTANRLIGLCLDHKRKGSDCVYVERFKTAEAYAAKNLIEINILKNDYFGLSHDIASILSVMGLAVIDMKFYYIKGEATKILCRAVASFTRQIQGNAKLMENISRYLAEDEAKRAKLTAPGEKLWFSFVGIFDSIARLLFSIDKERYPVEDTVNILKSNHEIMRDIIELLRSKYDPSCREEHPLKEEERNRYKEINEKIRAVESAGREGEANVLSFALNFARAVRKTDYFDYSRLREMFTLILDFSFLRPLLGELAFSNPGQIVYVYRKKSPIEILPIYSIEGTVDSSRYTETKDIVGIADPPLLNVLLLRGLTHGARVRRIAEDVLHDPAMLRARDFELFEGMDFVDDEGKKMKIDRVNIGSYFSIVAGALFHPVAEDGLTHNEGIYLYDISSKLGLLPGKLQSMQVSFLGEGGLKNVSLVQLFGESLTRSFIVGVNRRDVRLRETGHCKSEHDILLENQGRTDLLPRPLGFSQVKGGDGLFGVLYKEFLLGEDAQRYFVRLMKEPRKAALVSAVGNSISRLFLETGQGSSDYKLSNMIYYLDRIRFCDISPMTDDIGEVMVGFKQLIQEIPTENLFTLFDAVIAGGKNRGIELLARIRVNLGVDQEDTWASEALIEQFDKFARARGENPDTFYRYDL